MSPTEKRFPLPDELHPQRKMTVKQLFTCESCGHEGDFMFCPYCGQRRYCPSTPPDKG